jgi:hypothetical protein
MCWFPVPLPETAQQMVSWRVCIGADKGIMVDKLICLLVLVCDFVIWMAANV